MAQHAEKNSHQTRAVHKGLSPTEIIDGQLAANQSYAPQLLKAT
jgi:hypothetical protein